MVKCRVVLNTNAVFDLMKSDEMMDFCKQTALEVQKRLPEGYEIDEYIGIHRLNVSIGPRSEDAINDNFSNNTLEKVLGGML